MVVEYDPAIRRQDIAVARVRTHVEVFRGPPHEVIETALHGSGAKHTRGAVVRRAAAIAGLSGGGRKQICIAVQTGAQSDVVTRARRRGANGGVVDPIVLRAGRFT